MSNVLDFEEWRERLATTRQRNYVRRPRRGQGQVGKSPATGSDLSEELRRLLLTQK